MSQYTIDKPESIADLQERNTICDYCDSFARHYVYFAGCSRCGGLDCGNGPWGESTCDACFAKRDYLRGDML